MNRSISKKPLKQNKNSTSNSQKTKKKYPGFIQMFINMEWYGWALFIGVGLWVLYMSTIQIWLNQRVALDYLSKKYNKEFTVRTDETAPSWIGKPPTYHGLAKVKDGSDDVEFVVMCGLDDLACVDRYLETSWGAEEEQRIRDFLGNNLPTSVEIKVGITSNIESLNKKAQLNNLEYYLNQFGDDLLNNYQVMFLDKTRATNIQQAREIILKTSNYIRNKVKIGGIHYAIYNGKEKECVVNYDTHNKDGTLNNEVIFENAFGVKGEEKCH